MSVTPEMVAVNATVAPSLPQSFAAKYWVAAATSPLLIRLWLPVPSSNVTMPLLIVCDLMVAPVCKSKVESLVVEELPSASAE